MSRFHRHQRRWWQSCGVFCNEEGNPLDGDNLRHRVFYKVLAKAGLRWIRFHDLRHTFASLLIQNGESLTYVRDQLGHSSIQVTVDISGPLIPGPTGKPWIGSTTIPHATPAQPQMNKGLQQVP
jgi:integrase